MNVATTLILIGHLLCVNVAAGGPVVCAWLEWRGDALARLAARYLGLASLVTLIAGGMFGALLGLLKWTADYQALWTGPLSYKLHWGAAELVFSLVLASVYWLWVRGRGGESVAARCGRGAIAMLSGTNLLYHFPLLFIVAGKLHAAGQTSGERIGGAEFRQLMLADETPALAVHVVLASLAMAGVALLGLALRLKRQGDESGGTIVATWGGWWGLVPTLLQLPVGLWTLAVLPAGTQSNLMGSDALGTVLFLSSMVAALWLARELVSVALGESTRPALLRAMTAMLVVVALMTVMQQASQPRVNSSRNIALPSGVASWPPKS